MKQKLVLAVLLLFFALLSLESLMAQPRSRRFPRQRPQIEQHASLGLRLGNDFESEQYFAGAHFWLPLGIFWKFVPAAEYYFTEDELTRWQFNGDFLFKPQPNGLLHFGGGVAVQYLDSKSVTEQIDFGGNLIVGLDFGRRRGPAMFPFIQARWTFIEEESYFSVLGGINLILK